MDSFFKLKEHNTTIKTEFMAGLTTFFAMVYILMVNANMFANPFGDGTNVLGVSFGAIYVATAISAVFGTLLIGLLANLPLAQASGMGLNAFFVYTACIGFGLTYANALVLILFDGLIFIFLTVTGLRKKIFLAIPKVVRTAISAGIGLFIAFIGLQNSGIIVPDTSTGVTLGSFNILTGKWADIMPLVVTIVSLFAIAIMSKKKIKGAVLWGILGGMGLYYLLALTVPDFYANFNVSFVSPFEAFKEFGTQSFGKVFTEGFDFSSYISKHGNANLVLMIISTALAFCLIDMFDTLGTLYAACEQGNLTTKDGDIPNMEKAMFSDAAATVVGSICGTSTVTTFSESTTGVAEGGRTGLSSVFTSLFFFIAMFLSPVAQLIPSCATAAALIYVGVLMIGSVKSINWDSMETAVPAFLTMAMMPFAYNISYGIAFGLISYIVINLFTGKAKEIKPWTWAIAIMFIVMLLITH